MRSFECTPPPAQTTSIPGRTGKIKKWENHSSSNVNSRFAKFGQQFCFSNLYFKFGAKLGSDGAGMALCSGVSVLLQIIHHCLKGPRSLLFLESNIINIDSSDSEEGHGHSSSL